VLLLGTRLVLLLPYQLPPPQQPFPQPPFPQPLCQQPCRTPPCLLRLFLLLLRPVRDHHHG